MHKSISTLHVLAAGMLIMIVFEAILTVLKTHLMAHTSNRIDVALGARLFRHCYISHCAILSCGA